MTDKRRVQSTEQEHRREHLSASARTRFRLRLLYGLMIVLLPLLTAAAIIAVRSSPPTLVVTPSTAPVTGETQRAGRRLIEAGENRKGLALLLSIPPGHRDFARVQNYIAREFYIRQRGEVGPALPYAHRALLDRLGSLRAWEDALGVWLRALQP